MTLPTPVITHLDPDSCIFVRSLHLEHAVNRKATHGNEKKKIDISGYDPFQYIPFIPNTAVQCGAGGS